MGIPREIVFFPIILKNDITFAIGNFRKWHDKDNYRVILVEQLGFDCLSSCY